MFLIKSLFYLSCLFGLTLLAYGPIDEQLDILHSECLNLRTHPFITLFIIVHSLDIYKFTVSSVFKAIRVLFIIFPYSVYACLSVYMYIGNYECNLTSSIKWIFVLIYLVNIQEVPL